MSYIRLENTDVKVRNNIYDLSPSYTKISTAGECLAICDRLKDCNAVSYVSGNNSKYKGGCYPKKLVGKYPLSINNEVDLYIKPTDLPNQSDRNQIDNKVAEIYGAQGTNSAAFDENYRTTMLVGVVWAMLGTTVLYYTFKNL